MIIEEQKTQEEKQIFKIRNVTKNLHHLVSTQNIKGVYNSPYIDYKPLLNNMPVEQYIINETKKQIKENLKEKN